MKDDWFWRRLSLAFVLVQVLLFTGGLFFTSVEKATAIAGPVSLIVLALIGIWSTYSATATYDDHSKRAKKE